MNRRPRDSYKSRVFDALRSLPQKRLTQDEWVALNKRVRGSAWATKHVRNAVMDLRSYVNCAAGGTGGRGNHTDLSFCHAVAHTMTGDDCAWHGPEFCKNMIEATRKWIGEDEARQLRKKFLEKKVKLHPWSPEAKERAKARHAERSFDGAKAELQAMLAELEAED